jgi:hypothetical protein
MSLFDNEWIAWIFRGGHLPSLYYIRCRSSVLHVSKARGGLYKWQSKPEIQLT